MKILIFTIFLMTIILNVQADNKNNNLIEEGDLDKYFLSSLMYIMKNRSSKKVNNKNIVNLKVKETIDLTSPLIEIDNLKKRMVEEGKTQKGNLQSKEKDIEKSINDKQNKISKLKDSFDKIIQKTNNINTELNKKKDFSTQEKANLESSKQELDLKLRSLLREIKNIKSKIIAKKDDNLNYIKEILTLYKKLLERNEITESVSKLKRDTSQTNIKTANLRKIDKKSNADIKILSNIDKDIQKINKGLASSYQNTTQVILKLRKISLDQKNIKNLEFEKQQHNEQYHRLQKIIKELLDKEEILQNQVKDLEKKKNKLKETLNTKEVESKIMNDKIRNDIKNLKKDITKEEKNLLHFANSHNEILKEKEIRIKNLILILNKLLIKYKLSKRRTTTSAAELLNSILFDKKSVDLNTDDINEKVIEEISGQITK